MIMIPAKSGQLDLVLFFTMIPRKNRQNSGLKGVSFIRDGDLPAKIYYYRDVNPKVKYGIRWGKYREQGAPISILYKPDVLPRPGMMTIQTMMI